ncbi:Integrator complex subunit 12 [Armadillidium nasatum]|uniref:Integrator complex subunit 12 n=1 Tax=Armadillidium nasatum TaxID=96803 RepID=A0A5N5T9A4_9CRUS|nr:Integrator complex subunit 12 [Armadillidium nasatum]
MTTLDIEPLLRKGLKLLHSRHKDSADQLKALLDEAHRQRQGKSLSSIKGRDDDSITAHPPKRPKLDSPHNPFKSHTPSPTPSIKSESSSRSRKSDESDSDADMNELTSDLGINCTVCKSFEQTSGNQLVECQECHSLFHQECHKPPVSHQDITDPRLVWYCSKCSRTLKKQSSLVTSTSSSSSLVGIRGSSSSSSSNISSSTKSIGGSLSSNSARPSPTKSIGLQRPSPFTNLSSVSRSNLGTGNSSSSSSSSSSSNSSSSRSNISSTSTRSSASAPPAANSLMNAERRVHLMKKKAAAKNAERRKI